jgi:hypothetical protein
VVTHTPSGPIYSQEVYPTYSQCETIRRLYQGPSAYCSFVWRRTGDAIDLRLLGEAVKRLQEDMRGVKEDLRGVKLAIEVQGRTLAAQFQSGLQEAAQVIGSHLATTERRIENLVNVLHEDITDTTKRFDTIDNALTSILARLSRE